MPGRGSGKGQPMFLRCPVERRERSSVYVRIGARHDLVRTGRVRGEPREFGASRSLVGGTVEFRCSCGHVGWTNHVDVMRRPIEEETS